MKHYVQIEQLLETGAHFGHLTRRWNPKMNKFIFMERNGIHIIDLRKSQVLINIAREAMFNIAAQGKVVLFIGTKPQAKDVVFAEAKRSGMNYVSERWLGGMLTNFSTIRKSIKRLIGIDKMEVDGTFEKITKKERLLLSRERDRLRKVFGGIEDMTRLPGAIFVVDIKKEHIAIQEAKILDIPVIALVDTNCDPDIVDYPIPCNDDSQKAIDLITKVLADAVIEGSALAKIRMAEMSSDAERIAKESDNDGSSDDAKVKRRLRERRGGPGGSGPNSGGGPRGGNTGNRNEGNRPPRGPRSDDRPAVASGAQQTPKPEAIPAAPAVVKAPIAPVSDAPIAPVSDVPIAPVPDVPTTPETTQE